ncbi:MAG TPA: hypothetical protein DCE05_00445 [Microbacteriaceae bacterium]|nr:hypothetical protein [Microbacteriaceae bacterium]
MAAPFLDAEDYLAHQSTDQANALRTLMDAIGESFPELEVTLAWNVPHFRQGKDYVAGLSAAKDWVSFSPWSKKVMGALRDRLAGYSTTENLIRIGLDHSIDTALFIDLVAARLDEIASDSGL